MTLICLSTVALAQGSFDRQAVQATLAQHTATIDAIEMQLSDAEVSQDKILELREALKLERVATQDISNNIAPALQSIKANISDLGPVPEGEGAKPEAENIQQQRAALNEKALAREGLIKEAEALTSKSTRLLEQVAALRRGQFISKLFETQISPFNKSLWSNASQSYAEQFSHFIIPANSHLSLLIGAGILVAGLLLSAVFVSSRWLGKTLRKQKIDKLGSVAASLIIPLCGFFISCVVMHNILQSQDIVTELNKAFLHKTMGLIVFLLIAVIASHRLYKAGIIRASVKHLVTISAVIYCVDAFILEAGRFLGTPLELAIAQSYITTSIFALALGVFSYRVIHAPKKKTQYLLPKNLFFGLGALSIFILSANIFGYAALGRFVFERITLLFALLGAALLIRGFVRPYFAKIDALLQGEEDKDSETQENLIFFWLSLSLDIVLFFICLPLIANLFGAEWSDIREWGRQAFFGFEVGNMTISLAHIGMAIGVFLVLLFMTRFVQSILSRKILPKTKMDTSISQSITQILGYVGLIVALLAGISAIGFDLSNLALIAGALSVGIGFGLQSIVSNFVSGLILLFERPIKVNDWVITNSGEGIVKKISVRATEIETFDRTSIIVPNAELISSSVKNWTHKDKVGRVVVTVGVSYDSDPHKVRDILLKCAQDHALSLKSPEPTINFKDFADSALVFDVRFFIRNVRDAYIASTNMRFDIWDALKDAGIEISYPQRDLHIRTAPGLKGILNKK